MIFDFSNDTSLFNKLKFVIEDIDKIFKGVDLIGKITPLFANIIEEGTLLNS